MAEKGKTEFNEKRFREVLKPLRRSTLEMMLVDVARSEAQRPVWDCRVCGFAVVEGAATKWIQEHGDHYNAVSERVPNKGTAYCPTCNDETLRAPSSVPADQEQT